MTTNRPGYRSLTPAERLAGAFAREVRDAMTPEDLATAVDRNKAHDDSTCATHDFIDSNVCMLDAFKKTFYMTEPDPASTSVAKVMNEAWSLAKKEGFRR